MLSPPPLLGALASLVTHALALPTTPGAIDRRVTADPYDAPRLVNYVQTFHDVNGNPLSLLPLLTENTGITHVNLAALHINDDPLDITLNDNNPNSSYWDQVWSEVKQLQHGGIKVLMMMGGAAQGTYTKLCSSDATAPINETYYTPLLNTIRYHALDGLDLDIEESISLTCALALLRRLASDFGPSFLLTMAPVASAMLPDGPGLSGFDYATLDHAATDAARPNGKLVDWYNAQFYNGWGDASNQIFYDAILALGGWSPDRVVLGVLDNSNDGGSGFVGIDALKSVILQLRGNYGTAFGCAVGWEYWDAGGTDGFAYPYEWTELPVANVTTEPLPNPPAPFQALTDSLVGMGADYLAAVRALNITDGNLDAAESILGLS